MQDRETDRETAGATHPVWCSPEHCTVPQELPEDNPRAWGYHRSAPVMDLLEDGSACLMQPVCPWETSVHLLIEGKARITFRLEIGNPLLLAMRQHLTEQETRFPHLAADIARKAQRNADAAVVDARDYFEGKAA